MSGDFEIEVFRGAELSVRERALVLRAKGIQFAHAQQPDSSALFVRPFDAQLARGELEQYERENAGWPPEEVYPTLLPGSSIAAILWVFVLFAFFGLQRGRALGLPWWTAGQGRYDALETVQLWRPITSLTLHVDVTHLLSNCVFGGLFIVFLSQLLGPGRALFATFLSGALGNLIALALRTREGSSVGASTSVFAIIGLLVALEWLRRRRGAATTTHRSQVRRWAPILMGLVFLGYLGTSGERTDFLAHATGLLAGFVVGFVLPVPDAERHGRPSLQVAFGVGTAALVLGAWAVAFAVG